jgi:hypothetical protein
VAQGGDQRTGIAPELGEAVAERLVRLDVADALGLAGGE